MSPYEPSNLIPLNYAQQPGSHEPLRTRGQNGRFPPGAPFPEAPAAE